MIYVTHDQVEALTLGQRIVVMESGRVQQVGAPMDVYDRPRNRFVASFIGTPPMNFVRGRTSEVENKLRFLGGGLTAEFNPTDLDETAWEKREQFTAKDVVFGVRPEDITARPASQTSSIDNNRGCVADVEVLGDSAVVQVELNTSKEKTKNTVLLKTAARTTLAVGDNVDLAIDVTRAHLFDPQTDENLTYTESK
jgi:multiple sugar transport system ATP-binding protein